MSYSVVPSSLSTMSKQMMITSITKRAISSLSSCRLQQSMLATNKLTSSLISRQLVHRWNPQPTRKFNVHEYQAMSLFEQYGIATPRGGVAKTAAEAEQIAKKLGGKDFVVKAQVLAGGRGKGKFTNGFQGGVHTCTSPARVGELAAKMLGQRLITKQTGEEGKPVNEVLITERMFLRRETYFAILLDRNFNGPVMVASSQGGMDIEAVAAATPELIVKEPIDIVKGIQPGQLERIAAAVGFDAPAQRQQAVDIMAKFYKLFIEKDCTLIECNPFAETHDGKLVCVDGKLNFDDNAYFRQKDIFALRDLKQVDPREVTADDAGLNYIGLDGSIGCLVNGAGLAMSTMDIIKLHGGSPANFLDIGGGANEKQVVEAFKLLNSDPKVRAILVNIFGGIMRCDVIALGLIKAASEIGLSKPLVVRLAGTNVNEAKSLIEDSGLRMIATDDLDDAAQKAVRIAEIVKMAESVSVNVSFELPL